MSLALTTSENGTKDFTNDQLIPQIDLSVNGVATTIQDSNQILNTGGLDKHACAGGNEGQDWSLIASQTPLTERASQNAWARPTRPADAPR